MRRLRNNLIIALFGTVASGIMASCDRLPVYAHYEPTPIAGWEKNDTLSFGIPPVSEDGDYDEELGLRINDGYPFLGVCLVVSQNIFPSGRTHNDTINCSLFDQNGRAKGAGINYYQYNYHINTVHLEKGDSLLIQIRHNMKREIMPSITDVGIKVSKR